MTTNPDPNSWPNFNNLLRPMRRREASTGDRANPGSDARPRWLGDASPLCLLVANPVNPISGCKILAGDSELDFALPAALPLRWQRIYSSGQRKTGLLGQGWSTPLSDTLHISDGQLIILDPFQRDITFALPRVGDALYSLSEKITLERTGERSFELIDQDGLRRQFAMLPRAYDNAVLVGMIDANDNQIGIAWNARQLPETVTDSAGRVFVLDYITHRGQVRLGGISVQRDAVDYEEPTTEVVMQYQYDELGNLFQVINRAGEVTRQFTYMNHIMVGHAQPGGLVSHYEYDEYEWTGKVTRNWTNTGMSWNFRYLTGETLVYDHLGREELFRFDKRQRFTSMIDALGGETVRQLDNHGNVTAIAAPGERTTHYRYDRRSRVVRVESKGKGTGIVYAAEVDKPALMTDAAGAVTALRYDERGNLLSMTDALGHRTAWEYDAHGLPLTLTNPANGIQTLAYNGAAQLTAYTDCSGNSTHFSYDVDGKLLRMTDARGKATAYTYDAAGRLIAAVQADGAAERYEYDALGRLLARTDSAGKRTSRVLDVDGKPLRRIDAHGGVREYRYDAARRLAELIDEHGATQRFVYDALDRVIEETGVDARQTRYRYDASGLLAAKEEHHSGVRTDTTYTRDSAGQVIDMFIVRTAGEAGAEQSRLRFTYDDLGRLTHAITADAIVSLEYDAMGRLVSEQADSAGETTLLRHAYDQLGKRIRTTRPDRCVLDKLSAGAGHPHPIHHVGKVIAEIERDRVYRPAGRTQGALTSRFRYDPMRRMLPQVAGQLLVGEGAVPVVAGRSEYDESGNLLSLDARRQLSKGIRLYQFGELSCVQIAACGDDGEVSMALEQIKRSSGIV
ncbi:hypothetical protein F2P45_29735 [Massilia sp. CCM 8733]|uniref:Rhs family protein n=1 Tax=Massilia mucilaginosa TaxID=2609282 RepID=A0ABX0P346_9BURK|nr:DUF6531 domain-containing protein [Massilia mucilaginosa]NHZ93161.1 hypothetical protein [Massilia mucilaginosa]